MKMKVLLPILFTFVMFSVAYAEQITEHNIYFFEDSNEYRMGNGVVGLLAYKNKGLEQNRPTYYNSLTYEDAKANEEIYLEQYDSDNDEWNQVNFAHYSATMNEEEHTITKHYWNSMSESLDITYTLADYGSPAKISFKLWGFYGTYRIQWIISEINTLQVFDQNNKIAYVDTQEGEEPQKNNEDITPMSDIPITIDPPPVFPENYELMINYNDLIEAIGNEKVSSITDYNEDGSVSSTTFTLGSFDMVLWETLELDPQITSGHTTNQLASSILKNNNSYYISVMGDFESGTDDGAYILNCSSSGTFNDLSSTDTANWVGTSEVVSTEVIPNTNLVYTGIFSGKLGVYNRTSNIWTDLSSTDTANWVGSSDVISISFETVLGRIYTGLASGKFGFYFPSSNIWTDLSSTDTANWVGVSRVMSVKYNANNELIYTGLSDGKLGVYNRTSNIWTDLSSTDTANWVSSTVVRSLSVETSSGRIYTGLESGKFGLYYKVSNIWSDFSSTDTGDWVNVSTVFDVAYNPINSLIYTAVGDGKLGVYNRTSNIWTDLSSTDTANWVGTSHVRSLTIDTNNNLVYTGLYDGKFGVYNPSSNIWTDLSSSDTGNWMGTYDMYGISYDSNKNLVYAGLLFGKFGVYNPDKLQLYPCSKAVAMGGETAPRSNFIFADNTNKLHLIMSDVNSYLQEKNSSDGITWATKQQVIGTGTEALAQIYRSPKSQLMTNGIVSFATVDTASDPRWNTYNSTADTFAVSSALQTTSVNYGISSFVNNVTNKTYVVWGYSGSNVSFAVGSNLGTPSQLFGLNIGSDFDSTQAPQIHSYNGTLYLFYRETTPNRIGYSTCPATSNCNSTSDWTVGNLIDNAYGYDRIYNNIIPINNEGLFVIPRTNLTTNLPIYVFNNNTWFRIDNEIGITTLTDVSAFDNLNLEDGNGSILMTYSDVVGSYYEVFSNVYTLPDVLVKALDGNGNAITTNQTMKAYCSSTLMKTRNTSTGSIAIYPDDYINAGCSSNTTTVQLVASEYKEKNITVTRISNLKGYTLAPDPIGWNVSIDRTDCGGKVNGWDIFANNGTNNYTFTNQNDSRIFTVSDIDLTGNITFNFTKNATTNGITDYDNGTYSGGSSGYNKSYLNLFTYIHSITSWGARTGGCASASDQVNLTFYYIDGTANSTITSNSGNCNIWTFHTNTNPYPNKVVRYVRLDLFGDSYPPAVRNLTTYYGGSFTNRSVDTTRPTSTLTPITPNMTFRQSFVAWDRRFDRNISNFYVDINNGTSNITRQANGIQLDIEWDQLPKGNSSLLWIKDQYNNSYNTDNIVCNQTGAYTLMEYAGLQTQVFNEETLVNMTYNITIYNTTQAVTFLNQVNPMFKNYTQIPTGAITVSIDADGCESRQYYNTMTSTTFWNLTSYLLNNTEGLIRSFTVVDSNYYVLSGALIKISRFINNQWQVVAEKITDDAGVGTFLMNPSFSYQIEATYQGRSSGIKTIQPTESAYTIIIPTNATVVTYDGQFDQVAYFITPGTLWINSGYPTSISYRVVCSGDDLEWFNMTLTDGNVTQLYNGTSNNTEGGVLLASINTTGLERVAGTFTFKRAGHNTFTYNRYWLVDDLAVQNVSLVGSLFQFSNIPGDEMSIGAKSLIILVIVTAIMGTLYFAVGGFASAIIGVSCITVATFFGWFDYRGTILVWSVVLGIVFLQRGV